MGNTKLVVKSWRRRQYFFASASLFKRIGTELKLWLDEPRLDDGEIDQTERNKRVKALFRVTDYKKMFQLVGDALVQFIQNKISPFPGASSCQESFLSVAAWKRALVYINLIRYVTGLHANNHWYKYGYREYKQNKKLMDNYCLADKTIVMASTKFQRLPKKVETGAESTPAKSKKRRTRDVFELSSPEMQQKKKKIICLLTSSSDDGDDSDDSIWES